MIMDLTGKRFGSTTVLRRAGKRWGRSQWLCRCDCGREHASDVAALNRGAVQSCGCRAGVTHGEGAAGRRSSEYNTWIALRQRCSNPKDARYAQYGGRGITVCDRWSAYENFLEDMGRRPTPQHSIDRINNDGPYSPENCRWATAKEQANNQRHLPHGPDGKFIRARP